MTDHEKFEITHSTEYNTYIEALCILASGYVPKIRRKIAEKAFENFQNQTIRTLVLAYGEQYKKLQEQRLFDFKNVADDPEMFGHGLEDFCMNKASSYADAIKLLFEV